MARLPRSVEPNKIIGPIVAEDPTPVTVTVIEPAPPSNLIMQVSDSTRAELELAYKLYLRDINRIDGQEDGKE